MTFWESVLDASVRLSVPLLLVAIGELVSQRAGVINIGLEGKMAAGAFAGFLVMAGTTDPWIASAAAMAAGAGVAAVMAAVSIWGRVNQVLVGFALFVMVPGLVAFLYQQYIKTLVVTPPLPRIEVPLLSDIPYIGRVLFAQNGFYFATIILAVLFWIVLSRTRFGLSVTACGHDPEVAHSKGIAVNWVRTRATLIAGALAGLGGAALTVGALGSFSPGVTGGRGFIAIAIVILGRWSVGWTVLAGVAVGLTDALRLRLGSQVDFPIQILAMLPWIVVLAMLVAGARFANMPRALGRNFGSAGATD